MSTSHVYRSGYTTKAIRCVMYVRKHAESNGTIARSLRHSCWKATSSRLSPPFSFVWYYSISRFAMTSSLILSQSCSSWSSLASITSSTFLDMRRSTWKVCLRPSRSIALVVIVILMDVLVLFVCACGSWWTDQSTRFYRHMFEKNNKIG